VQFNSKLEFSMRQEDRPLYELASVSPTLAAAARMRPAVANHYLPAGAMEQKIAALALRTETQARDIFDLDFLITRYSAESLAAQPNVYELDLAGRRVFEVTYREYLDLVVTYIDPAFVSMYRSEEEWERIALNVATRLDSIRAGVR